MSHCLPGAWKTPKDYPNCQCYCYCCCRWRCWCCSAAAATWFYLLFLTQKKIVPKHYFYLKQNLWLWKLVELNGMGAILSRFSSLSLLSAFRVKRICFNLDETRSAVSNDCVILRCFWSYRMLFLSVEFSRIAKEKSQREKICSAKSLIFGASNKDIFSTHL